jgi:hypothetical protein
MLGVGPIRSRDERPGVNDRDRAHPSRISSAPPRHPLREPSPDR